MDRKITLLHKLILFCLALIIARIYKTGNLSFVFLSWNLFLAWLPLFFARRIDFFDSRIARLAMLAAAILFLPNAPYILTDLFHLEKTLTAPLWFDLVLILSFAYAGLVYFIVSLEKIIIELGKLFSNQVLRALKPLLFLASGYGIYLGRYLRFNSWDVITHPVTLAGSILHSVFSPDCFKETGAVTITFTVFLYLVYEIYLSFKHETTAPV